MLEMKIQVESLDTEEIRAEASLENEANLEERTRSLNKAETHDVRCRNLSYKLSRILRLMKMTGLFYGKTPLDENQDTDSSRCSHVLYCVVVLCGQWILFVQAMVSLFHEGVSQMSKFYLLLIFGVWYLQGAIVTTISLIVLPNRHKTPSRFTQYIRNLLTTETNFTSIKTKSVNRLLAMVCLFAVSNTICLLTLDVYGGVSIAKFSPWNDLFQYRFLHVVFGAFDSCSWSIPFLLFCVSSGLLAEMFENLKKKILSDPPSHLGIAWLRQEHHKLCETVALADKVFSPFLMATVTLDIPLICINFHQLVKAPSSQVAFILSVAYWCVCVVTKLAIIMKFGVRVNEKVKSLLVN